MKAPAPWFVCPAARPAARVRLVCLPYAGGSSALYHHWPKDLPPSIEVWSVEPPGRNRRFGEQPATDLLDLAARIAGALAGARDPRPWALFGYSLGGLVAFELARRMLAVHLPPVHLFVAACAAPHLPLLAPPVHALPDDAFLAEVKTLGGTPPQILENSDLRSMLLPSLRADFHLLETYRYTTAPPLDCPITAFCGRADNSVSFEEMQAWREHTSQRYHLEGVDGDHFILQNQTEQVLTCIVKELDEHIKR